MNSNKTTNILFVIIFVIVIAIVSYIMTSNKPEETKNSQTTEQVTSIIYNNSKYGFYVTLPLNWKGYTVLSTNWEGNKIDTLNEIVRGPEISIRHPLWTSINPRQDIPIMIFTPEQWDLVQEGKLSLGAAPVGPSELGRNANYIFALPARYNFAFPTGFEEVQKIIENNSFHAK